MAEGRQHHELHAVGLSCTASVRTSKPCTPWAQAVAVLHGLSQILEKQLRFVELYSGVYPVNPQQCWYCLTVAYM